MSQAASEVSSGVVGMLQVPSKPSPPTQASPSFRAFTYSPSHTSTNAARGEPRPISPLTLSVDSVPSEPNSGKSSNSTISTNSGGHSPGLTGSLYKSSDCTNVGTLSGPSLAARRMDTASLQVNTTLTPIDTGAVMVGQRFNSPDSKEPNSAPSSDRRAEDVRRRHSFEYENMLRNNAQKTGSNARSLREVVRRPSADGRLESQKSIDIMYSSAGSSSSGSIPASRVRSGSSPRVANANLTWSPRQLAMMPGQMEPISPRTRNILQQYEPPAALEPVSPSPLSLGGSVVSAVSGVGGAERTQQLAAGAVGEAGTEAAEEPETLEQAAERIMLAKQETESKKALAELQAKLKECTERGDWGGATAVMTQLREVGKVQEQVSQKRQNSLKRQKAVLQQRMSQIDNKGGTAAAEKEAKKAHRHSAPASMADIRAHTQGASQVKAAPLEPTDLTTKQLEAAELLLLRAVGAIRDERRRRVRGASGSGQPPQDTHVMVQVQVQTASHRSMLMSLLQGLPAPEDQQQNLRQQQILVGQDQGERPIARANVLPILEALACCASVVNAPVNLNK